MQTDAGKPHPMNERNGIAGCLSAVQPREVQSEKH